jgi:hypothetical protein
MHSTESDQKTGAKGEYEGEEKQMEEEDKKIEEKKCARVI